MPTYDTDPSDYPGLPNPFDPYSVGRDSGDPLVEDYYRALDGAVDILTGSPYSSDEIRSTDGSRSNSNPDLNDWQDAYERQIQAALEARRAMLLRQIIRQEVNQVPVQPRQPLGPVGRLGRRLAGAALTSALLVSAPTALEPDNFTSVSHVSKPDGAERSTTGICVLSEKAKDILREDCKLLPNITHGAHFTPLRPGKDDTYMFETKKIGAISAHEADISNLPTAYQEAFKNAMRDPIIRASLKQYPVTINQVIDYEDGTYAEADNASFYPDADAVSFEFDVNPKKKSDIYMTYGAIHSVWLHEAFGHGTFDGWYEKADKDPAIKQTLLQLGSLCRQDLDITVEKYQEAHGLDLQDNLIEVIDMVEGMPSKKISDKKREKLLDAVWKVYDALDDPERFANMVVSSDRYNRCTLNRPDQIIVSLSDNYSFSEYFETDDEIKLYDQLYEGFDASIAKQFAVLTESHELKGITKGGGHPYDNTTERVASTVANIQTNPDGYIKDLGSLPLKRQRIQASFIDTLYRQLKRTMPKEAKESNFAYVLAGVRQNIRNHK